MEKKEHHFRIELDPEEARWLEDAAELRGVEPEKLLHQLMRLGAKHYQEPEEKEILETLIRKLNRRERDKQEGRPKQEERRPFWEELGLPPPPHVVVKRIAKDLREGGRTTPL